MTGKQSFISKSARSGLFWNDVLNLCWGCPLSIEGALFEMNDCGKTRPCVP